MGVFNHTIELAEERWDEALGENYVQVAVNYDDAFGERCRVLIAFSDPVAKKFLLNRIKVAGRAITGAKVRPGLVLSSSPYRVEVLHGGQDERQSGTYRWIDDQPAEVGSRINLIESVHPTRGSVTTLATARQCDHPGLMSMNILVLDESANVDAPREIHFVNLFTGDSFVDA